MGARSSTASQKTARRPSPITPGTVQPSTLNLPSALNPPLRPFRLFQDISGYFHVRDLLPSHPTACRAVLSAGALAKAGPTVRLSDCPAGEAREEFCLAAIAHYAARDAVHPPRMVAVQFA